MLYEQLVLKEQVKSIKFERLKCRRQKIRVRQSLDTIRNDLQNFGYQYVNIYFEKPKQH